MKSKPLIELENVTFTYPGVETPVLTDVTLSINEGDFTAIIGGNGSGKSTLCKTFNGLIPQFYVGEFEGRVITNGLLAEDHTVAQLSKNIGYVYQDFDNQLLRPTVIDDVCFTPLNFGLQDYKERGEWALKVTGLEDLRDEFVWQLSGGQKHLLALAGALAMKPKMLVIDEPIAQLDPQHAKRIYDILRKLNIEYEMTIVVIEHHTEFIAHYCHEVILMDKGRVLWKKTTKEALSQVAELMKHQIYPPQVTQAAHRLEMVMSKNDVYPTTLDEAIDHFTQQAPSHTEMGKHEQLHGEVELRQVYQPIIQFQGVFLQYRTLKKTVKHALTDINISCYEGDLITLVGNNGAGKSSLIKLITGIMRPSQGDVLIQGINTRKASPEKLSDFVSYVYQKPEEMFIDDSVRKDIEYYLKARKVQDYEVLVEKLLEDFSLVDIQHQDGRLLSGGQQRRASLAIGAAMNPSIILLDEPTANLDIATKKHMVHMLNKLRKHVKLVIVATHDMQLVSEWANRVIVMNQGRILCDGDKHTVFGNEVLMEQAGLVPPQILQLSQKLQMKAPCHTVEEFITIWSEEGARLERSVEYA